MLTIDWAGQGRPTRIFLLRNMSPGKWEVGGTCEGSINNVLWLSNSIDSLVNDPLGVITTPNYRGEFRTLFEFNVSIQFERRRRAMYYFNLQFGLLCAYLWMIQDFSSVRGVAPFISNYGYTSLMMATMDLKLRTIILRTMRSIRRRKRRTIRISNDFCCKMFLRNRN